MVSINLPIVREDQGNVSYDGSTIAQVGSNPLFPDIIYYNYIQKTEDYTTFEPSLQTLPRSSTNIEFFKYSLA